MDEMYSDLKHQLILNSKEQRGTSNENLIPKSSKDVLKILKRRLAADLSEDGVSIIYVYVFRIKTI